LLPRHSPSRRQVSMKIMGKIAAANVAVVPERSLEKSDPALLGVDVTTATPLQVGTQQCQHLLLCRLQLWAGALPCVCRALRTNPWLLL
jgi:hypothetical protein